MLLFFALPFLAFWSVASCLTSTIKYLTGIAVLLVFVYLTGYRTAWIGIVILIGTVFLPAGRSIIAKLALVLLAIAIAAQSGTIVQSMARYAQVDQGVSLDALN